VAKAVLRTIISVPPTKRHMSLVNTENNVGGNIFCNGDFTEDWHILVNLNLLCGFINKCINWKHCSGVISLFENPSNRRYTVNNLVIKCWEYDHIADIMTYQLQVK
jgi:hypothetical protein